MNKGSIIFPTLAILVLTGCSLSPQGLSVLYVDKNTFTKDSVTLSIVDLSARKYYGSETFSTSLSIELVSTNPKQTEYTISSPIMVRESDGAEYSPTGFIVPERKLNLECDIKEKLSFTWSLPSSYAEVKYALTFKGNGAEFKFCLYDMPDEIRKTIEVRYVVDGLQVKTAALSEGKLLSSYDWISDDYIYGCNTWYQDAAMSRPAPERVGSETMTIYGTKQPILKYNLPSATSSSFVSGYNLIPSSGEVVVPRTFEGKPVYSILAGSFKGDVTGMASIYIPKTVRISGVENFNNCKDLKKVYFEGNRAEWSSLNEAAFKSTVEIVFNTYK